MARASIKNHQTTKPQFIEQIYSINKKYNGIIFLDRDGTIIKEINYLRNKTEIEILPTVIQGIRLLNEKGIAVIIITNQPVIARGLLTINELKEINNELVKKFKNEDAQIDAIFSCPHHPEKNHPDIPKSAMKYRIFCNCRKPNLSMYKQALNKYGSINMLGVIGDQTRDILTGNKLKISTVIINTGYKGKDSLYDASPDFTCNNFLDAVNCLI